MPSKLKVVLHKLPASIVQLMEMDLKTNFRVDENILCYEPNQTNSEIKMLYDAKILNEVRDELKSIEGCTVTTKSYLVEFTCMGISWNRRVGSNLMLKSNRTNRHLQRRLYDQAKLKTPQEILDNDGDVGFFVSLTESQTQVKNKGSERCSDGSDSEDEPAKGTKIPNPTPNLLLNLPDSIIDFVDKDYVEIKKRRKLTKLPADSNVTQILEDYAKHFGLTQFGTWVELQHESWPSNQPIPVEKLVPMPVSSLSEPQDEMIPESLAKLYSKLKNAQVFACALRDLFDDVVGLILLYNEEKVQFEILRERRIKLPDFTPQPKVCVVIPFCRDSIASDSTRPRVLKSSNRNRKAPKNEPVERPEPRKIQKKPCANYNKFVAEFNARLTSWSLINHDSVQDDGIEAKPSLVYGVSHLLRLIAKIPELLNSTGVRVVKLQYIVEDLNHLVEFLTVNDYITHGDQYLPLKSALSFAKDRTWPISKTGTPQVAEEEELLDV